MDALAATLHIYQRVFSRGAQLTLRNWPVLGSLFAYALLLDAAAALARPLGLVGGILLGLVWGACLGSALALVESIVRAGRVTLADFRGSFTAYLWDVIGVLFTLGIFDRLLDLGLAGQPQAPLIRLAVWTLVFVFFNALPELIYLSRHSLLALFGESYRFIGENWIEWFPPNLLLAALLWGCWRLPAPQAAWLLRDAVLALLVYFALVVRGLLFLELSASTRRGRIFRHRVGR